MTGATFDKELMVEACAGALTLWGVPRVIGRKEMRKRIMSDRSPSHVRERPMAGDVIEIRERAIDPVDGAEFTAETMLRVVAVHEERVWFKEYGLGHRLILLKEWQDRLGKSSMSKMIRGADHDSPF